MVNSTLVTVLANHKTRVFKSVNWVTNHVAALGIRYNSLFAR